ncbi:MAG: class I SAM-dependent methyltransferase [Pseudomonadota bacterium]
MHPGQRADDERAEMLATNAAQAQYYDQRSLVSAGEGAYASQSVGDGRATRLWRAARARAGASVSGDARARVHAMQASWIGPLDDLKVLDLGCARGSPLTWHLAKGASEFHALDLSPRQVDALKGWLGDAPRRHFHAGDVLAQIWGGGGFDVIYAHSVLHHFPHIAPLADALEAHLAPGGRVVAYDPLDTWLPGRAMRAAYRPFQTDADWEFPFTAQRLAELERRFQVLDRVGVFGWGKWAWALGLASPALARRWGDTLFFKDFAGGERGVQPIRGCLHVALHLQRKS